jgi:SAM-dependent methyltransferase
MNPWRGRVNAEVYDRFVRDHQVYRRLNDRISELADLREARRVLDLACGTGATALACLPHMAAQAELVGVDASEDMIEVARANVRDPRVEFRVGPASSVSRIVEGPFDRAVCNAAFWQFSSPRAVLDGVRAVLEPGARFVFNVPAERIEGERAPLHPFQIALARALEERSGRPFPTSPAMLRTDRLLDTLRETGFDPDEPSRLAHRGRQAELIELMAIPAMLSPLAPELSEELLHEAWEKARARSDPDESVEVEWIFFAARRE